MNLIFTIVYVAWFLSEFTLSRLLRSGKSDQKGSDKNSLALIWIVVVPAIILSSFVAQLVHLPIAQNAWIPYAGLILIVVGMIARLSVVRSLGRFFTVDVTIREDHQLKKDGFYSIVRHPSYFAAWLSFVGFGISVNNWISLLIVATASFAVFLHRIRIEEEVLIRQFGDQYLEYKKSTRTIIPFVF